MTEGCDPTRAPQLTTVTLREQRDADGLRRLSECEWAWVVAPDAVPALVAAHDGREGDDPLQLLAAWSAAHDGADPGPHLREVGVPLEFWNRVGE
jgi:hypothetical protein